MDQEDHQETEISSQAPKQHSLKKARRKLSTDESNNIKLATQGFEKEGISP
jgi:hypothetical protein